MNSGEIEPRAGAGDSIERIAAVIAGLSMAADEGAACDFALPTVAEEFGADGAALVVPGQLCRAHGWTPDQIPEAGLIAAAGGAGEVEFAAGAHAEVAPVIADDERPVALVIVRRGSALDTQQRSLFSAYARAIGSALMLQSVMASERSLRARVDLQDRENRELVATLHDHERLEDAMASIRQAISGRAPLPEVLDAIVGAVSDLLGGYPAALYLIDPSDGAYMTLVASRHLDGGIAPEQLRRPVGVGLAGRAIGEDALQIAKDYPSTPDARESFVQAGVKSAFAAPVHENGRACGCLVVASYADAMEVSEVDKGTLTALADHVSLALADAKSVDSMVHQALHDALTGLPNRALFSDRLEHALVRGRRLGSSTAVLFVDLDRFKHVNDSLGHSAGDELLVEVARRLDDCRRGADTAARLGGDEFAVLLEDLDDRDEATRVARRILDAISEPFQIHGRQVAVSASIGVAIGETDADDFLRHADVAMYRAKATGPGRLAVFEGEMQDELIERIELANDLGGAVGRGEIEVRYQPVVEVGEGQLAGFEALMRWRHPERGLLAPRRFLDVAEETGAILELGRHILRAACDQAAAWSGALPSPGTFMSVNLSARQLQDPELVGDVRDAIADAGIEPRVLMLEIAESLLMHDAEAMVARLQELRAIGVRLAIDDFGTGRSSLSHLRRFPVDALKMDKPFVDGLTDDRESAALARAIVDLAASLGISCIAEGIETAAQREALLRIGCRWGQGFHYARPARAGRLTELLGATPVAFPV